MEEVVVQRPGVLSVSGEIFEVPLRHEHSHSTVADEAEEDLEDAGEQSPRADRRSGI